MNARTIRLASRPRGTLEPENFELRETSLRTLESGEVLVRNTWLSIDPSVRIRLDESTPAGYLPPFEVGDPLDGLALGVVVESRCNDFQAGDTVMHMKGYRDHAIVSATAGGLAGAGTLTKIDAGESPLHWFLGPLGSSGLTAYVGLFEILDIEPTDTVWISAAGGAVGSIAAQLARQHGCTVIASAGSRHKVDFLTDELGVASAFDYHDGAVTDLVAGAAPEGIDAYFDNVGGEHFVAALDNMRAHGRIAMCGAVSTYGSQSTMPSNLFQITAKSLQIRGFRAGSYNGLYDSMRSIVGPRLRDGSMHCDESIYDGLESAPVALIDMLAGRTSGKTLCRL